MIRSVDAEVLDCEALEGKHQPDFELEARGEIDIRSKGKMKTFLLGSRRDGI